MGSEFREREAIIKEEIKFFFLVLLSGRRVQLSHRSADLHCDRDRESSGQHKYQFSRVGRSCVIIDHAKVYGCGEFLQLTLKCL